MCWMSTGRDNSDSSAKNTNTTHGTLPCRTSTNAERRLACAPTIPLYSTREVAEIFSLAINMKARTEEVRGRGACSVIPDLRYDRDGAGEVGQQEIDGMKN